MSNRPIALLTGASGFIGHHLVKHLLQEGFEVRALARANSKILIPESDTFKKVMGDLTDFASLRAAVHGVTYVFHLAGAITAPNRESFFKQNAEGTLNLIRAVNEEANPGFIKFIFVSSLAAGGPMIENRLRTEVDEDRPVSAYGESKLAAEAAVLSFKDSIPVVIIRPPMVYGPGDKATFIFVKTISRNLFPSFGEKYYSIIHVSDLCSGIVQSGLENTNSGEVFFLCNDLPISYDGLMLTIARLLSKKPVRVPVPRALLRAAALGFTFIGKWSRRTFALNRDKLSEIEPDYWICSNEKAKSVLRFSTKFTLESGMADAIAWYRAQGWI